MQKIDIEKNIKRIADYYKTSYQEQKTVEEIGELLIELGKNMATNTVSNNTASELADVSILLRQLSYLYGVEEEVDKKIKYKLERQIKRIERRG